MESHEALTMLDLPNWFWNVFAITVFVVITAILCLHGRWCKTKGIKPKPAFPGLKKHEKQISKWMDVSIAMILLLIAFFCVRFIILTLSNPLPNDESGRETAWSFSLNGIFLILFFSSTMAASMTGLLSPFHRNINFKKRIILLFMCCLPLAFWLPIWLFDDTFENNNIYLKLLPAWLFAVFLINWPAVFLGKPFVEFFPKRLRKILLPWFQLPPEDETRET